MLERRDDIRMTEPLIVAGVSISGFVVKRELEVLHFTGWTVAHIDETTVEHRIVLRFEMGSAQARALRKQLVELLRDEH